MLLLSVVCLCVLCREQRGVMHSVDSLIRNIVLLTCITCRFIGLC